MRHWNNGTDDHHSKSCCDKSSPARRTIKPTMHPMLIITVKFRLWVYSKKIFAKLIHRSQTRNILYGTPTWILENAPLVWIFIINGKSSQVIGDGHLVFSNRYLFWKVSTVWFKKYCSKIIPLYIVAFINGLKDIDKQKQFSLIKWSSIGETYKIVVHSRTKFWSHI